MSNTLIVNLFKHPESRIDVSVISSYVTCQLKIMGISVECVKSWTNGFKEDDSIFSDDLYIVGRQSFEISKLIGNVDIIVNEIPLLNFVLTDNDRPYLKMGIVEKYLDNYNNYLNIYLSDIDEDFNFKNDLIDRLNNVYDRLGDNMCFIDVDATIEGCNNIVVLIQNVINKLKD